MSYFEKIDQSAAKAFLGASYREGLSYSLITDRDKFVIQGVDASGRTDLEVVLDATPDVDEFVEEEDDFSSNIEQPKKHESHYGTAIAAIMLLLCAASIFLAVYLVRR